MNIQIYNYLFYIPTRCHTVFVVFLTTHNYIKLFITLLMHFITRFL